METQSLLWCSAGRFGFPLSSVSPFSPYFELKHAKVYNLDVQLQVEKEWNPIREDWVSIAALPRPGGPISVVRFYGLVSTIGLAQGDACIEAKMKNEGRNFFDCVRSKSKMPMTLSIFGAQSGLIHPGPSLITSMLDIVPRQHGRAPFQPPTVKWFW